MSPMEWAGGLERLLKVLEVCATPMGLRSSGAIGHGHHLLPMAFLVLILLVMAVLGQSGVIATVSTTVVVGGLGLATEVGLDNLLTDGVLGGDVQELPCHVRGLTA